MDLIVTKRRTMAASLASLCASLPHFRHPPIGQRELSPPGSDRNQRSARPPSDFVRRQTSNQRVLLGRPSAASRRRSCPSSFVGLAHLPARFRRMQPAKIRFAHRLNYFRRPRLPTLGRGDFGPTFRVAGLGDSLLLRPSRPRLAEMRRTQFACTDRVWGDAEGLSPDGHSLWGHSPPKSDGLIRLPTHGLRQVAIENQRFRHPLLAIGPRDSSVADAGNFDATEAEILDGGAIAEERRAVGTEAESEALGVIQVASPYSQLLAERQFASEPWRPSVDRRGGNTAPAGVQVAISPTDHPASWSLA